MLPAAITARCAPPSFCLPCLAMGGIPCSWSRMLVLTWLQALLRVTFHRWRRKAARLHRLRQLLALLFGDRVRAVVWLLLHACPGLTCCCGGDGMACVVSFRCLRSAMPFRGGATLSPA